MNAPFDRRWWSWQRGACLVITVAILALIFRRIDAHALRDALVQAHPGWLAAAFLGYGMTLVLGGLRWHIALKAIRCAVHVAASVRLTFIGHFFFLVLFGAAAGDVAKSALYARWYRFDVPELAASAPIDRALGFLAALLVGGVALSVGLLSGGFQNIPGLRVSNLMAALVMGFVVALGFAFVLWKPTGESWWARAWRTFRAGTRNLASSPRQFTYGLLLAVAAQIGLSAVFALNVRAVAGGNLPWLQMAWTFPAVMMLSCLPITVAGVGMREMLALTLLGFYGVPPGECVGAALLTFLCKVAWGLIGGLVLARETNVQQRAAASEPAAISVVIPVLNEAESLPEVIRHLNQNKFIHEIIVVDGGSSDRTRERAAELGCRVLATPPGRGGQMRAGAAAASGDVLLLVHADTWLPPHATRALLDCLRDRAVVAGGFWKEFRDSPWLLLGSKWKCAVRLWVGRRIAGDQCLFIRREALERIGGIPDMALMEEFVLSERLRRIGRLALAEAVVMTSARRFQKLGVIRTYLRMWRVTMQYRLGVAPTELRKLYESGK